MNNIFLLIGKPKFRPLNVPVYAVFILGKFQTYFKEFIFEFIV